MFVGHYAASFAAKTADKRIPLWQLFLATQFIDILWAIFILIGVEKASITKVGHPGSPLNLYYMPFTHSLVGALVWSGVIYAITRIRTAYAGITDRKIPLLLALTVFSHWIADVIMHAQDLPLFGNQFKVGLGVYRSPELSFWLEEVLFLVTLIIYMRTTKRTGKHGKFGIWIYAAVLTLLNAYGIFGPLPPSIQAVGIYNLTFYLVNAFVISRLERKREPKNQMSALAL